MAFQPLGKQKIIGRRTFQPLGKQKSLCDAILTFWKAKSSDDALSEASESKNPWTMTFPRPRFLKNLLRQHFRGLVS